MNRIKNTEGNENISRPGRRVSMQSSHRYQFTTTDMKRKRLFIRYNETTTAMRAECRKKVFIMKTVFICSPFRGNEEENAEKAKFYARIAIGTGAVPIVPHLYFPMFLDEKKPAERMQGIEMGLELMDCCDEVWVFGFNITSGMQFELDHARDTKVPVRLYDKDMNRINLRTLRIDDRATPEYMASIKGLKLLK